MIETRVYAEEETEELNVKVEAKDGTINEIILTFAAIIDALETIKNFGTKGTEGILKQATTLAMAMERQKNDGMIQEAGRTVEN